MWTKEMRDFKLSPWRKWGQRSFRILHIIDGSLLPTFRDNLTDPSSIDKLFQSVDAWPLRLYYIFPHYFIKGGI
jgi:hypothetical protein